MYSKVLFILCLFYLISRNHSVVLTFVMEYRFSRCVKTYSVLKVKYLMKLYLSKKYDI